MENGDFNVWLGRSACDSQNTVLSDVYHRAFVRNGVKGLSRCLIFQKVVFEPRYDELKLNLMLFATRYGGFGATCGLSKVAKEIVFSHLTVATTVDADQSFAGAAK